MNKWKDVHMRKVILLLLLIPLVSCQDVEKTNSSVKNVLLDINMDGELRLSEIADTVEVILLEQTDDSDIALVERFIPYKDRYYVMSSIGFSNGRVGRNYSLACGQGRSWCDLGIVL